MLANWATKERPLIICLDSVEQLSSGEGSNMSWLPTKLPPYCKFIVSCTKEDNNPRLCADYEFLNQMLDAKEQFMEVEPLGVELAWIVIKKWMVSAGRDLNNYQWRVVANAIQECSLPIFLKLVLKHISKFKLL